MGTSVVDAGVLIALLDETDVHHDDARAMVAALVRERVDLVLPASAYAETLVGPTRRGPNAVLTVEQLIEQLRMVVYPVDVVVARHAAGLRAQYGGRVRLPDALVIGTAMAIEADSLVTLDSRWPDVGVAIALVGGR